MSISAAKRRKALYDQGLCISCGVAKATKNRDGRQGVRCDECCAAQCSSQRGKVKGREAKSTPRYDADEKGGYVEPAWRTRYREQIRGLLKRKGSICTRDVHEAFGYDHQDETVDVIKSVGDVEGYGAEPVRYRFRPEPRRIPIPDKPFGKPRHWERVPRPDSSSLYGREALA